MGSVDRPLDSVDRSMELRRTASLSFPYMAIEWRDNEHHTDLSCRFQAMSLIGSLGSSTLFYLWSNLGNILLFMSTLRFYILQTRCDSLMYTPLHMKWTSYLWVPCLVHFTEPFKSYETFSLRFSYSDMNVYLHSCLFQWYKTVFAFSLLRHGRLSSFISIKILWYFFLSVFCFDTDVHLPLHLFKSCETFFFAFSLLRHERVSSYIPI